MTTAPILPYLVGAIVLTAIVHRYLWMRLVRDASLTPPRARAAFVALTVGASLLPIGMLGLLYMRVMPLWLHRPLMTTIFSYIGALYFLLLALLALELRRASHHRRANAGIALFSCAVLSFAAVIFALLPARVRRADVRSSAIPRALQGYRVVQLSDLHVGPTLGRDFVEGVVASTKALSPDLVVITGDLVDGSPGALLPALAPLASLTPRDGVFMVLGNHEYLSGADAWRAALPSLGIRVLSNEAVFIGEHLELVGIDEAASPKDIARAFATHTPSRVNLTIAHEPALLARALSHRPTLALAGHTHGGQLFPLHVLEWLDQGYLVGSYSIEDTMLYVSAGAGFWGPPMRLGSLAEISWFELSPR